MISGVRGYCQGGEQGRVNNSVRNEVFQNRQPLFSRLLTPITAHASFLASPQGEPYMTSSQQGNGSPDLEVIRLHYRAH